MSKVTLDEKTVFGWLRANNDAGTVVLKELLNEKGYYKMVKEIKALFSSEIFDDSWPVLWISMEKLGVSKREEDMAKAHEILDHLAKALEPQLKAFHYNPIGDFEHSLCFDEFVLKVPKHDSLEQLYSDIKHDIDLIEKMIKGLDLVPTAFSLSEPESLKLEKENKNFLKEVEKITSVVKPGENFPDIDYDDVPF